MIVYYIVFIVILFLAYIYDLMIKKDFAHLSDLEDRKNGKYNFLYYLIGATLISVAGLRYRVGVDYISYFNSFETRAATVLDSILSFEEPGLNIIAYFINILGGNGYTFIFILSFFTIALVLKTIYRECYSVLNSLMLYFLIGAWHGSFNGVRQYAASAILFWGHKYLYEKNFYRYTLIVLIATMFHFSAIVMIPIYFLVNRKFNMKQVVLLIVAALAMQEFYSVVWDVLEKYKGHDLQVYTYMMSDVSLLRVLVAVAPIILFLVGYKKVDISKKENMYLNLLLLNAVFMIATSKSAYLARLGIFTDIYATIAIPMLTKKIYSKYSRLIIIGILFLYGIFWFIEVSSRSSINNFKFIL